MTDEQPKAPEKEPELKRPEEEPIKDLTPDEAEADKVKGGYLKVKID